MAEVVADPQVQARGLALDMDGLKGVRSPFTFAERPIPRPAPTLGESD